MLELSDIWVNQDWTWRKYVLSPDFVNTQNKTKNKKNFKLQEAGNQTYFLLPNIILIT